VNPFFLLQAAAAPAGGGASPLTPFLFQLALISGIIYFLMIRPQQKQRKSHEERLRSLKRGDQIVTGGGIIGEIVHMKDSSKDGSPAPTMEDPITIKSAESRLVIERGRIARVITPTSAGGSSSS
jgi:preprotein translocase subunit YajC